MHWKLNKYLVEQTTRILRRLFTYNTQWTNSDIEIVQIASGSAGKIFEQYFKEKERYPVVIIEAAGGNYSQLAFNDLWRVVNDDVIAFGDRALNYEEISDVNQLQIPISDNYKGEILRGIDVKLAWSGNGVGGDNINVNVYSNFTTFPQLIGSGSIEGNTSIGFKNYFAEFASPITLTGEDFYITFDTGNLSSYYIAIDPNYNNIYRFNQNGSISESSGSIVGNLYLPAFIRLGTNFESSLNFIVQAKNDTKTVYNLVELIAIYFTLAKHGSISRESSAIDGLKLETLQTESLSVSELSDRGIYVRNIRQGGLITRKRGDNDNIFSMTVSIDFFTEWFQDFPADTIKDFNITIDQFLRDDFSITI
ncbi:MAG: hypothetical protein M0Q88_09650 [Bacilli bacterium]|nr:hypothetical protein [Bacilli bacterium]